MEQSKILKKLEQKSVNIVIVPSATYLFVFILFIITLLMKLPERVDTHTTVFALVFFFVAVISLLVGGLVSWRLFGQAKVRQFSLTAISKVFSACIMASAFGEIVAIYGFVVFLITGDRYKSVPFFLLSAMFFPFVLNLIVKSRSLIDDWRKRLIRGEINWEEI